MSSFLFLFASISLAVVMGKNLQEETQISCDTKTERKRREGDVEEE